MISQSKQSRGMKRYWETHPEYNPRLGTKHTLQTIKKIQQANRGKRNPEWRKNISLGKKKHYKTTPLAKLNEKRHADKLIRLKLEQEKLSTSSELKKYKKIQNVTENLKMEIAGRKYG